MRLDPLDLDLAKKMRTKKMRTKKNVILLLAFLSNNPRRARRVNKDSDGDESILTMAMVMMSPQEQRQSSSALSLFL